MTLTPEPPDAEYFVLVWREPNSRRLRTYVDSKGFPISTSLDSIFPQAADVVRSPTDMAFWLSSPVTDETVAVSEAVARSELGWSPQRGTASERTELR